MSSEEQPKRFEVLMMRSGWLHAALNEAGFNPVKLSFLQKKKEDRRLTSAGLVFVMCVTPYQPHYRVQLIAESATKT